MKALVLSEAAENDLRNIARYTRKEWGDRQATDYLGRMRGRLALLRQHPEQGTARDDVRAGYRTVIAGSHVVFYRVGADHIEIVRVLHENMDVHKALAAQPNS